MSEPSEPAGVDPPSDRSAPGSDGRVDATLRELGHRDPGTTDLEDARVHGVVRSRLFGGEAAPLKIDRFTLVERLGEGGSGEVWSAYDPRLDRRVALKLVHARGQTTTARERLIREARVTGRLVHPNIVSMFDVGMAGDRVFLAMEYIDGLELGQWVREQSPSQQERMTLLLQAGRGLAEAHRSGVVHRDFKPANVMVRRTSRTDTAVVVDFGLARQGDAPTAQAADPSSHEVPPAADLTRTGQRMGTPAYMAPEQYAAGLADARSDQFSFCLTVYETLTGHRPFATVGEFELHADALAEVPRRLRAPLGRGLQRAPDDRFPDMDALLTALAPRHRLRVPVAAAVLGTGLVAALVLPTHSDDPCETDPTAGPQWTTEQREPLAKAIESSSPLGPSTWDRLQPPLADYVEAWRTTDRQVCTDHRSGRLSDPQHERARACLVASQHQFDALLRRLAEPNATVLEQAPTRALDLHESLRCADPAAPEIGLALPSDPELAAAVTRGREHLIRARTLQWSGATDEARTQLEHARAAVGPGADAAFEAEYELSLGGQLIAEDKHDEAADTLVSAYGRSETLGHDRIKLLAGLTITSSLWSREPRRARWWSTVTLATAERVDPLGSRMLQALENAATSAAAVEDAEAEAGYLERMRTLVTSAEPVRDDWLGAVAFVSANRALRLGQLDEARRNATEAHEAMTRALGELHPRTLRCLMLLGIVERQREAYDAAEAHFAAALRGRTTLRGPDDPRVAEAQVELGTLADIRGDLQGAERRYLDAIAVFERNQDSASTELAATLENLGIVYARQERFDEAAAMLERVLRLSTEQLGPEHSLLGFTHHNLANMLADAGRPAEALPHAERAVSLRKKALGAQHPRVARSMGLVSRIAFDLGDLEAARRAATEAIAAVEQSGDSQAVTLVWLLDRRARSELAAGNPTAAIADLQRAIEIDEASEGRGDPDDAAAVRFRLARLLRTRGKTQRAETLARDALERWRAMGPVATDRRAAVETWLAEPPSKNNRSK